MKMVKGFESMLAGSLDLEEPWYITGAEFNPVKNEIDVHVGIRENAVIACPRCGGPTKRYGYEPTERSWRHADCLFYPCYVYGDSGYLGAEKKDDAILVNNEEHPIRYQINKRPSQLKKASGEKFELLKAIEHAKSSVRSKVEHVFCVIKRIFHFCKTRYRGREKLHQHCCTLFALANLYLARNRMKVV